MIRLYFYVEGQTEQEYVTRALRPHLARFGCCGQTAMAPYSAGDYRSKRLQSGWFKWEVLAMSIVTMGTVKNGVVVPNVPLPEGASVEIHVHGTVEVPPDLQEEFDDWERAGAGTIEMVERLAQELENDEKR